MIEIDDTQRRLKIGIGYQKCYNFGYAKPLHKVDIVELAIDIFTVPQFNENDCELDFNTFSCPEDAVECSLELNVTPM